MFGSFLNSWSANFPDVNDLPGYNLAILQFTINGVEETLGTSGSERIVDTDGTQFYVYPLF